MFCCVLLDCLLSGFISFFVDRSFGCLLALWFLLGLSSGYLVQLWCWFCV